VRLSEKIRSTSYTAMAHSAKFEVHAVEFDYALSSMPFSLWTFFEVEGLQSRYQGFVPPRPKQKPYDSREVTENKNEKA